MWQSPGLPLYSVNVRFQRTKNHALLEIIENALKAQHECSRDNIWVVLPMGACWQSTGDFFPMRITCNCDEQVRFAETSR